MSLLYIFGLFTGFTLRPQIPQEPVIETGIASFYDYGLGEDVNFSKKHLTCAFHNHKKDYGMYKVCASDRCIECFNNDWMRREDRLVDLSSYAFSLLGDKRKGLLEVSV